MTIILQESGPMTDDPIRTKKIYREWNKIVLAITPVFSKMAPSLLRFFRDKSDYNPLMRELAAVALLKTKRRAVKHRKGPKPRSTKRPTLRLVHLTVRRKDV